MPFTQERFRSRNPFQLWMLSASTIYSILGIFNRHTRPGSVQEAVGQGGTLVWLVFVLLGSLAALMGISLKDRATGLYAEQVGLLAAGLATGFYALVAIYKNGPSALASASVLAGFGGACLVRSWQLHRKLNRVRKGHDGSTTGG